MKNAKEEKDATDRAPIGHPSWCGDGGEVCAYSDLGDCNTYFKARKPSLVKGIWLESIYSGPRPRRGANLD